MSEDQEFTDRGPARTAPRDSLFLLTILTTPEGMPLGKARVRNLSSTGLMADCERPVPAGSRVLLDLRGVGEVAGVVAWSRDDKIGLAFDEPIDPQLARRPVSGAASKLAVPDYLRSSQLRRR